MDQILQLLWLVPVLPLIASVILVSRPGWSRRRAHSVAIGALGLSGIISLLAFMKTLGADPATTAREVVTVTWFQMGVAPLQIGWVLDPLTAVMLTMVTFVGTLIFIFSTGYMASDERYRLFFAYLSLFAAAMLGMIISNSLLLLFICWELVGVASYLLIGFWAHKPSAAAAAKKAFITTRIGDIGFFIGMLWLASSSGSLLFFDNGSGCLEENALGLLGSQVTILGLALSTAISLLILWGAMGKSGQFPLHVWLPDAMEGPTPVSALIHAATMVAAGVFLMARLYPLMAAGATGTDDAFPVTGALIATTFVGSITALLGALIAVAQTDIKRILAYSTVSQLGYMMMGLGTGGPAVAMFHLITHAFFKALLFLGAGSVIHGCHDVQDIRRMGGLKGAMPVTFATYAIGMLALAGFPLLFAGFWSKDAILHSTHTWSVSHLPYWIGLIGAFLTAFYMTRQMFYVFFGGNRLNESEAESHPVPPPHESPAVMTWPLIILAAGAVLLGFIGTPAFPWFQGYIDRAPSTLSLSALFESGTLSVMILSSLVGLGGIGLAYLFYRPIAFRPNQQVDPLQRRLPRFFDLATHRFWIDELYDKTIVAAVGALALVSDLIDRKIVHRIVECVRRAVQGIAWVTRFTDEHLVNGAFDRSCDGFRWGARQGARLQSGQTQRYLKIVGSSLVGLVLVLIWISRS